jgi:hypothetical protein
MNPLELRRRFLLPTRSSSIFRETLEGILALKSVQPNYISTYPSTCKKQLDPSEETKEKIEDFFAGEMRQLTSGPPSTGCCQMLLTPLRVVTNCRYLPSADQ